MTNENYDFLIKGGTLVYGSGAIKGDILVKDEKICAIMESGDASTAKETIDATGKYVLPGVIDVHTHCDMPVYSDQFQDVTRSAACGGVTSMLSLVRRRRDLEMELLDSLKLYIEDGEKTSYIDFSIHGGFIQGDDPVKLAPKVVQMGIPSFKMLMAYSGRGFQLDDGILIRTMGAIASAGGLAMIHAENGSMIDFLEDRAKAEGRVSANDFGPTRPGISESEATYRAYSLARTAGCPIYFVHMSARESIDILQKARMDGAIDVWTETCPQYLLLTDDAMNRWDNLAKVAPPLRYQEDLDAMWSGCRNNIIDVIGSDHAGYDRKKKEQTYDAKQQEKPNIFEAIFGMPGVESMLPLIHQEGVNSGRISLSRMVELLSENPARIFDLFPKKGILQVGSDADILIFDPNYEHTISAEKLNSNVDYTVYEGWKCNGGVITTMLRGDIISEKGELKGKPGKGRFLPRKPRNR